jgi:hypothetical protein
MSDALKSLGSGYSPHAYDALLHFVAQYVGKQTVALKNEIVKIITESNIPEGYWGSGLKSGADVDNKLKLLLYKDEKEWASLLGCLGEDNSANVREELKRLSPFADNLVLHIKYGCGFVTIGGELQKHIEEVLQRRGLGVYDGQNYVVALPMPPDNQIRTIPVPAP